MEDELEMINRRVEEKNERKAEIDGVVEEKAAKIKELDAQTEKEMEEKETRRQEIADQLKVMMEKKSTATSAVEERNSLRKVILDDIQKEDSAIQKIRKVEREKKEQE